jgi:hypothetical protein
MQRWWATYARLSQSCRDVACVNRLRFIAVLLTFLHVYRLTSLAFVVLLALVLFTDKGFDVDYFLLRRYTRFRIRI